VQTGGNWKETIKLIFTMSLMVLTVMLFNNITVDQPRIGNAITRMDAAMGGIADEQRRHALIEAVTMLRTLEPGMGAFNYLLNAVGLGISGNVELVRHAPNPTGIIYFLISMMYLLFLTFMSQLSTPEPGTRTTRSLMSYIPSMPSSFTQFAHPRQPQQRVEVEQEIVPPPMPELTEPQDRTMPIITESAIALANEVAPPLPDDTPEEFIDHITMDLMNDPETLSDGSTFDHDTVQRWIFGDGKSMRPHSFNPLTRAEVTAYVTKNTDLKAKIDAWKAAHGMRGGTRRGKKRNTKRRIQSKYKSKRYRRCKCKRSHRRNRMTRRT
jgi:hypothetical protein